MDTPSKRRRFLVPVDESQGSEKALAWALDNLFKEDDMVHLFHVVPTGQYQLVASTDLGTEGLIDGDDAQAQAKAEDHAREFISARYSNQLLEKKVPFQVEIVRFAQDSDSIGAIVCKRAEQLGASAVIMAKHNKGRLQEFFVGSVTSYCTHHCNAPVLVMHCD